MPGEKKKNERKNWMRIENHVSAKCNVTKTGLTANFSAIFTEP